MPPLTLRGRPCDEDTSELVYTDHISTWTIVPNLVRMFISASVYETHDINS